MRISDWSSNVCSSDLPGLQGRGLARRMLALAEASARARGFKALELQARIELTENHRAFAALGFEKVGEGSHPGYTRPTDINFRKRLSIGSLSGGTAARFHLTK